MLSGITISGFTVSGDTIDVTDLAFSGNTSVGFDSGTDILTVNEGGNSATIQLDSEDYTSISWVAGNDAGSGTNVMVACFLRGTLILTDHGEVPVEELAIGDAVMTRSGAVKPVRWIGRRSYDGRFIAGNRAVLPIRVAAGALGERVPARDLWLSPEHALAIDDALVPAVQLVNGLTITQAHAVEWLQYFHIELEGHDIIFADGAPAETYVDCDNRFMFQNAGEFAALYPGDKRPAWDFCAPRREPGSPELAAIRAALLERAERLGYARDLDPELHLVVDGAVVTALSVSGLAYRFEIPAGSSAIWLVSRSAVPAEIEVVSRDRRRLGVPVERVVLCDGDLSIEAWHGHIGLSDGFHDDEATHRWTDGLGRLPGALLRPFAGAVVLELHLVLSTLAYPVSATERSDSPSTHRLHRSDAYAALLDLVRSR